MNVLKELGKTVEDDELLHIRFSSIDGVGLEGVVEDDKLRVRKRSATFIPEEKYGEGGYDHWSGDIVTKDKYVKRVNDAKDQLISRLKSNTDLTVEQF